METLPPHIEAALNALGIAPARECVLQEPKPLHTAWRPKPGDMEPPF